MFQRAGAVLRVDVGLVAMRVMVGEQLVAEVVLVIGSRCGAIDAGIGCERAVDRERARVRDVGELQIRKVEVERRVVIEDRALVGGRRRRQRNRSERAVDMVRAESSVVTAVQLGIDERGRQIDDEADPCAQLAQHAGTVLRAGLGRKMG